MLYYIEPFTNLFAAVVFGKNLHITGIRIKNAPSITGMPTNSCYSSFYTILATYWTITICTANAAIVGVAKCRCDNTAIA